MVSVERVLEYTRLPPEAALVNNMSLSDDWPERGGITAENASFQYSEDQNTVLKYVNFDIKPNEKVNYNEICK